MDAIDKAKKKTKITIRSVTVELKNHFHAYCVKRGISMSKLFRQFMKDCVMKDIS